MTNEEASTIVGNMPINGDECYSIPEYQQAKAMAIKALEQQVCEDCISRQSAHDVIENAPIKPDDKWFNWMQRVCNRLAELPSVTPQPTRWIPVSERLPESNGVYIVTREFSDGFECVDITDACYFDGTDTWYDDNRINHDREYVNQKIKAWIPLPEPYKARKWG